MIPDYKYWSFYDILEKNGVNYIINTATNELCIVEDLQIRETIILDKNLLCTPEYFTKMISYGEKIFMIPHYCHGKIYIYNIRSKDIETIDLQLDNYNKKQELSYETILYLDYAWIFPMFLDIPLLKIDLKYNKIHKIWGWNKSVTKLQNRSKRLYYYTGLSVYENRVYIAVWETQTIIETSLETLQVRIINPSIPSVERIASICTEKDAIWMLFQSDNYLYKYELEKNMYTRFYMGTEINSNCIRLSLAGAWIVLLPVGNRSYGIDDIILFHKERSESIRIDREKYPNKFKRFNDYRGDQTQFWGIEVSKNIIKMLPCACNMLLEVDLDSINLKGKLYEYPDEYLESKIYPMVAHIDGNSCSFEEGDSCDFGKFIEIITYGSECEEMKLKKSTYAQGVQIWNHCKKMIGNYVTHTYEENRWEEGRNDRL